MPAHTHTKHFNIDHKDMFGMDAPHKMQLHPRRMGVFPPTRHQQPSAICLDYRNHLWPLTLLILPLTTYLQQRNLNRNLKRAGVDPSDRCFMVAGKPVKVKPPCQEINIAVQHLFNVLPTSTQN